MGGFEPSGLICPSCCCLVVGVFIIAVVFWILKGKSEQDPTPSLTSDNPDGTQPKTSDSAQTPRPIGVDSGTPIDASEIPSSLPDDLTPAYNESPKTIVPFDLDDLDENAATMLFTRPTRDPEED